MNCTWWAVQQCLSLFRGAFWTSCKCEWGLIHSKLKMKYLICFLWLICCDWKEFDQIKKKVRRKQCWIKKRVYYMREWRREVRTIELERGETGIREVERSEVEVIWRVNLILDLWSRWWGNFGTNCCVNLSLLK